MSKHHDNGGWTSADRAHWRPIIAASLPAACIDCGRAVYPEDKWQIGHRIPKAQGGTNTGDNLGPSHTKGRGQKACNQIAGGKLGRAMQLGTLTNEMEDPRGWPVW